MLLDSWQNLGPFDPDRSELGRSKTEQTQDRRGDLEGLDRLAVDPGGGDTGRVDDQRHVQVLRISATVLGDLLRLTGVNDAVLYDSPDVGVPRVVERSTEVLGGTLRRRRPWSDRSDLSVLRGQPRPDAVGCRCYLSPGG